MVVGVEMEESEGIGACVTLALPVPTALPVAPTTPSVVGVATPTDFDTRGERDMEEEGVKLFDFAGEEEGGGDIDAAPDTVGKGDDEVLPLRDPTPKGVGEKGRVGKRKAEMPGVPVGAIPVGVTSIVGAGVSVPTTVTLEDTDAEGVIPLDCDPRVVPEASLEGTAVGVLPALPVSPTVGALIGVVVVVEEGELCKEKLEADEGVGREEEVGINEAMGLELALTLPTQLALGAPLGTPWQC